MPDTDILGAQPSIPNDLLSNAPTIDHLRRRFDEARSDPNGRRVKNQRNRDYYDGPKQLSSEVRETLKNRNQPAIYTNRVRPAINGILGILEASNRDPQAYPRNPDDQDAADVCTKTLRFIADQSNFAETKMDCAENFLIEGTCAAIIEMDGDDIKPTQIRWEEFYHDPYARRPDLKDARYMGIAKWMDAEQLREQYHVRINEIGDPLAAQGAGFLDDSWQDRPQGGLTWIDIRRRRVMVVEEYAIEKGQWTRCKYIATGVLEYGPSPYLDEKRRPCNPIEAVSCYVDRENNRYSLIDDMVPIQDEINASRSRSLHLMNSRQVQNTDTTAPPVDDIIVRQEAAKADGVLPMGWQIVQHQDMTQSNMVRMQEAKAEIERMGPTPAVLGRAGAGAESGRARQVLQAAGLTELARPLARHTDWELRCYKQMWARAQQFKTEPWFIRVTDDVRAPQFMQVNEPIMGMVMQPDPNSPAVDPTTGQPMMDPSGQPMFHQRPTMGVVGHKNRLAEMDMDIIIDSVPDSPNLEGEVWGDLVKLVAEAGGLQAVFTPQFELMIELSPLPDKRKIIEKIQNAQKEQAQASAQQQQEAAQKQQIVDQVQLADATADIAVKHAKANLDNARAGIEPGKADLVSAQAAKAAADAERAHTQALDTILGPIAPRQDVD